MIYKYFCSSLFYNEYNVYTAFGIMLAAIKLNNIVVAKLIITYNVVLVNKFFPIKYFSYKESLPFSIPFNIMLNIIVISTMYNPTII